jgi:pimeloyl-ACP methyl ester carboxylesterase
MRALAALLLVLAAGAAAAQDYAREKRWAAEVVPNVVVGDAVQLRTAAGREFLGLWTEVRGSKTAVLLVHGIGVHPDHGVIGVLRVALADSGWSTLSIQMPVQAADAPAEAYYPALFPEAAERIAAGLHWLEARGWHGNVLLSHSLGSWMAEYALRRSREATVAAWICLGRGGEFGDLGRLDVPVLDVYGEHDLPQVLRGAPQRRASLQAVRGSRQIMIRGADHFYTGHEQALAAAIRRFVAGTE